MRKLYSFKYIYENYKKILVLHPVKISLLALISEFLLSILLVFLYRLNIYIAKKIIILLLLFFYFFWKHFFRVLNKKLVNNKFDSDKITIFKFLVKFIFRIMLMIHIIFILATTSSYNYASLFIIVFYVYILKDFVDFIFKYNISIIALIFLLSLIYVFSYSNFILPFITFGGYYFVNWLSSEDSLYYFYSLSNYNKYSEIYFKVNNQTKLRWATQKANMLFILISTNITFAIKSVIPNDYKDYLLSLFIYSINKFNSFFKINISYDIIHDKKINVSYTLLIFTIIIYSLLKTVLLRPQKPARIPFFSEIIENQIIDSRNYKLKRSRKLITRKLKKEYKKYK